MTRDLTAAVDAAMIEMQNVSPPLRRSDCARLIRAALSAPSHGGVDERAAFEAVRDCKGFDFFDNCYWLRATPECPDEKALINADWELWQAACNYARAALPVRAAVADWSPVDEATPEHNQWVVIRWNGQFKVGQFDSKHPFSPAIVDRIAGKYWNFSEWSPVAAAAPSPSREGE